MNLEKWLECIRETAATLLKAELDAENSMRQRCADEAGRMEETTTPLVRIIAYDIKNRILAIPSLLPQMAKDGEE